MFTEKPPDNLGQITTTAEPEFGFEAAQEFLKTAPTAEGLEASVFAAEPMLRNPTDIDIDAHVRV